MSCKNCVHAQVNGGTCLEVVMSDGNWTWLTPIFPDTPEEWIIEASNQMAIRRPDVSNGKPLCNGFQEV